MASTKQQDPKTVAAALHEVLRASDTAVNSNLEPANVTDGLFAIARGLEQVARALEKLGTSNADTPMGAIEMLSSEVKDGFRDLSEAVRAAREE